MVRSRQRNRKHGKGGDCCSTATRVVPQLLAWAGVNRGTGRLLMRQGGCWRSPRRDTHTHSVGCPLLVPVPLPLSAIYLTSTPHPMSSLSLTFLPLWVLLSFSPQYALSDRWSAHSRGSCQRPSNPSMETMHAATLDSPTTLTRLRKGGNTGDHCATWAHWSQLWAASEPEAGIGPTTLGSGTLLNSGTWTPRSAAIS